MAEKKTFVVGDVHGCFDEFLSLLDKAQFKKKSHRLILVGDVISRGPHSFKMLNWIRNRKSGDGERKP